jgi:hypothetical protein
MHISFIFALVYYEAIMQVLLVLISLSYFEFIYLWGHIMGGAVVTIGMHMWSLGNWTI